MAEIATAFVTLVPSMKGFSSKVQSSIGGDVDKVGRTSGARFGKVFATASMSPIRAIGAAALGLFAIDKAKDFMASAISSASNAQQSVGATQTVFGRFSASVIKESRRAAEAYGLSANDFRESSNLIGALLKNQGVAQDQLAGKTKKFVKLGADLSATYGGSAKQAVEALSSAFKGEFDPLEQYGISLRQSTINTEAYRLANVKTQAEFGKLSVAQQKAMTQQATSNVIMKQSAAAHGQFAKQTGTLAEQQQIAAAKFDNLKARIGTALLPVVTGFFNYLNTTAIPAFAGLIKQMRTGEGFGGRIAAGFQAIKANLDTIAPALAVVAAGLLTYRVAALAAVVVTRIQAAATAAATAQTTLLNLALRANPIGLVITAVTALGVGLVIAYKKSATFRAIVQGAFAAVKAAASAVASFFTKQVPAAFNKVKNAASTAFGWVRSNWPLLLGILTGPIGLAVAVIAKNWNKIIQGARGMVHGVTSFISSIPGKVMSALGDLGSMLLHSGEALIQGFIDGINAKASAVTGAASNLVGKVRDFFPFSPAKKGPFSGRGWVLYSGHSLSEALAKGIKDKAPKAAKAAFNLVSRVKEQIDRLMDSLASMKSSIADTFTNGLFDVSSDAAQQTNVWAATSMESATKSLSQRFLANLLAKRTELTRLLSAFNKLVGWGLSPQFLSSLFQSGNGALILDLAGSKAQARQASAIYGQVNTLATRLGGNVATEVYGPQIVNRLHQLTNAVDKLPNRLAREINGAAKNARRG